MIGKQNKPSGHKYERGQGLVEFALVLPTLLLTIMGIADFGRLFAVYSNLFNAAREGTRYGVVNPLDVDGISQTVRDRIDMVDPALADVYVSFDSGPDTGAKDFGSVTIGDRVVVAVNYDVEMMTPFVRAIAEQLHVETISARTIATLGQIGNGEGLPVPPTGEPEATPEGTVDPDSTPVPTADGVDTPVPSPTGASATPGATATPTPTPGAVAIQIDIPLMDGDMVVTGIAQPDEVVNLRDIQNPSMELSAAVGSDGVFRFNLSNPLIAGHVISVQGYGSIDYAVVEGEITPTSTSTPTATPIPTATPKKEFMDISPECGPVGGNVITVTGHQWVTNKGDLIVYWDGAEVARVSPPSVDFEIDINVDAAAGTHTVMVEVARKTMYNDSKTFTAPCPITPTPTPSHPNLVVESVTLENGGILSTYDALTFTVAVRNVGAAAANSLFWVDLYADPAVEPPTPSDLMNQGSIAWAAVSSLAQNETISLTLDYPQGFEVVGDHVAYALADTWTQVNESDEADNVSQAVLIPVPQEGTPPTPTPTPDATGTGAISGSTWLYINGDVVPQGRVNVYLYEGEVLIAEVLSDQSGDYVMEGLPAGTYTMIGETYIDGVLYSDVVLNVLVESGQTTQYMTLVLH